MENTVYFRIEKTQGELSGKYPVSLVEFEVIGGVEHQLERCEMKTIKECCLIVLFQSWSSDGCSYQWA